MRIFADENIPLKTIEELRSLGHDVTSGHDRKYKGLNDLDLWKVVQKESRILITTDKGFANFRNESHSGILIIRLRLPNWQRIHIRVLAAITESKEADWHGLIITMRDKTKGRWKSKFAK